MPSRTVFLSSKSEVEIPHGKAVKVRISNENGGYWEADLTPEEGEALVKDVKAEIKARRGRKPKADAK